MIELRVAYELLRTAFGSGRSAVRQSFIGGVASTRCRAARANGRSVVAAKLPRRGVLAAAA